MGTDNMSHRYFVYAGLLILCIMGTDHNKHSDKLLQIRLLNAGREDCHILLFANWINIVTNNPFKESSVM